MNNEITLLIDGNNTIHRTHWIANNIGTPLVNSKGIEVGSIFTFLKTIKSYVDQFNASKVYIAWDKKLTPAEDGNFRSTLTEGNYKATRDADKNKDVYKDMDNIIRITKLLGISNIFPGQLEADDVISWLTTRVSGKKIIVSVDRDFIQLISPEISYYNPIKKLLVDTTNFEENFGLTPKAYIYYKAIVGDKSDNIPGIEGYGEVKGIKLAKSYFELVNGAIINEKDKETILKNEETIKHNLKLMDLSYGLKSHPEEVKLYEEQYEKLLKVESDFEKFKKVCEELEFNSIINKFDSWQASFNKKATNELLTEFFKTFE